MVSQNKKKKIPMAKYIYIYIYILVRKMKLMLPITTKQFKYLLVKKLLKPTDHN